jgi:cytidylate kinase
VSPLVPAEDAIVIDSTATPIAEVFAQVMQKVEERGLIQA